MPAFLLLLLFAPLLSGCVGLAVGALATGGISFAEDRSLGEQIDDLAITFDVSQRLNEFGDGIFSDVSVDVTEGRVLLTGNVAEPHYRVDAVRLAWQAADVVEVSNELAVGESGSIAEALSDIVISNELRTLLVFDSRVNKLNFNVEDRQRCGVYHRNRPGRSRTPARARNRTHHIGRGGSGELRPRQGQLNRNHPMVLGVAFQMDPVETVDIDADTTFVLALEAQERGHETCGLPAPGSRVSRRQGAGPMPAHDVAA